MTDTGLGGGEEERGGGYWMVVEPQGGKEFKCGSAATEGFSFGIGKEGGNETSKGRRGC